MTKFYFINIDTNELVVQDNFALPSEFESNLRNTEFGEFLKLRYRNKELFDFESKSHELENYEMLSSQQVISLEDNFQDQLLLDLRHSTKPDLPTLDLIDAVFEPASQEFALKLILEKQEKGVFLQVGGNGIHAIKALFIGFHTAVLITPVKAELLRAFDLAAQLGIRDRLFGFIGFGEKLPLKENSVDCVYFGGSLHHTDEIMSWGESLRVLRPGGFTIAVESFEAPLYRLGVHLLGKREKDVNCIILNKHRIVNLISVFNQIKYKKHGFLHRYILISMFAKFNNTKLAKRLIKLQLLFDRILPELLNRLFGSSIVIFQEKN